MMLTLSLLALFTAAAPPSSSFDRWFEPLTMRVDYYHTRDRGKEILALDGVVSDGAWAGKHSDLLDTLNLGTYRFVVHDSATGEPIYSRGYSSIYAEWVTTPDTTTRTFQEALRFPWPRKPVQVTLEKRDPQNAWMQVWSVVINPSSWQSNRAAPPRTGKVWTVFENGPPEKKVDLVLVGDGYTAREMQKFHADVRRLTSLLFGTEPFRSHRRDFNVRAIDLASAVSGINRPQAGRFRRTPLGTSYNIFGLERYVLTYDDRALRNALSGVPYEFIEILVNDSQYGGGGIFNAQATVAVGSKFSDYVFVHEFGHHFAALADEYYTSPVAYQTGGTEHPEPWEPNVTALHDPARLKWRMLVDSGVPIPTPWPKQEYESVGRQIAAARQRLTETKAPPASFDSLFRVQRDAESRLMRAARYAGKTGAFEGASYEATGLYRSALDCIMFSRTRDFCRVCRNAIERVIAQNAGP